MNNRSICFISVFLIIASSVVLLDGSDADWVDPGYRDPPEADNIMHLTDELRFGSSDPAFTVSWSLIDGSGTDNADAACLMAVYVASSEEGTRGYSCTSESCLPSWITWDAFYSTPSNAETSTFEITIRPALQQVSENTVGDYWIWFECTHPQGLGTRTDTYLIEFTVNVDWDGGVIVPDTYSEFILRLDYGIPGGTNNKTLRIIADAGTEEVRFTVRDMGVVRDGYSFRGWSQTSGSSSSDIGDEFPMNIHMAGVSTTVNDDGCEVHETTIHAVWEPAPSDDSILDPLREVLDILGNPAVLGLILLLVFGFALIVRIRGGGY